MAQTILWFQKLVTAAWEFMSLLSKCQLITLPSTYFCKVSASKGFLSIKLMFGVQQGDLDTFLSTE